MMHVHQQTRNISRGWDAKRHGPERTCVGCKLKQAPQAMLRLVCTPHNEVMVDSSGHAPGRGVHVCYHVLCLQKTLQPARLRAALKAPVITPSFESIYHSVLVLLDKRLGACLSMAQKAGAVVSGYAALQKALAQKRVLYLVLAEDIVAARAEAYDAWCTQYNIQYVTLFMKEELGRLIGKPSRSAIGLTTLHFCELFSTFFTYLEQLRTSYSTLKVSSNLSYRSSSS